VPSPALAQAPTLAQAALQWVQGALAGAAHQALPSPAVGQTPKLQGILELAIVLLDWRLDVICK
jgi:hypothetical protein